MTYMDSDNFFALLQKLRKVIASFTVLEGNKNIKFFVAQIFHQIAPEIHALIHTRTHNHGKPWDGITPDLFMQW